MFNRAIGFGDLFTKLQTTSKFPHYNIIEQVDGSVSIELALAGYSKNDVEVEVNDENFLRIFSSGLEKRDDIRYTYKGIAKRSFSISFALGKFAKVVGANMTDGVLRVDLKTITPKDKSCQKITIN
jgi:molecular chaperone IbpA